MAKLSDGAFWLGLILSFSPDEAGREAVISRMSEKPGMDRANVEHVLATLRQVVEEDAPQVASEPTPEEKLKVARYVAKMTGKTVEQLFAEDLFGERMQVLDNSEWLIAQGNALFRALDALECIEPEGWFERSMERLLRAAYRQRLDRIVELLPDEMADDIAYYW